MNKFIALGFGGFVALAASQAFAGVQTQTGTFGPSPTDLKGVNFTVQGFTGTGLQSVQISVSGSAVSSGTVTNNSPNADTFTVNVTSALTITGPGTTPNLTVTFSPTATVNNLAAGASANFGPVTGANTSATVAGTPLSAFGPGLVSFTANTSTSQLTTGGGGNGTTRVATNVGGTVTVVYTFADPVTTVPEPASMALLGIGLAGLGLIRRRSV